MANNEVNRLTQQLSNKSSAKRRSAAKKLRKLKAKEAGPALLDALKNELKDKRTWETQYQMIMALGETEYTDSLDFLTQLVDQEFKATMVYIALGDAITRLQLSIDGQIKGCLNLIKHSNNPMLINGILRAIAMLRLNFSDSDVKLIITYGKQLDTESNCRTWIAAAAPGWPRDIAKDFLNECIKAENQQTKRAAEAALKKKYLKWSPL